MEPELELIRQIQKYSYLYDKNHPDFKDYNKKDEAWDAIADDMVLPVDDLKRLWKNLRERFGKERKLTKQSPSGSKPLWPYFEHMSFMKNHIATRKRLKYITSKRAITSTTHHQGTCRPAERNLNGNELVQVHETGSSNAVKYEETSEPFDLYGEDIVESVSDPEPTCTGPSSSKIASVTPRDEMPVTLAATIENQLKDVLYTCNKYVEKEKPDKNMTFGKYVGLALSEMSPKEQNYKRIKIVEVLGEEFVI